MATPKFANPALVAVNTEVARVAIAVNESKLHLEQIDERISGVRRELSILMEERRAQTTSHNAVLEMQKELERGKNLLAWALGEKPETDEADITDEDDIDLEEL